MDGFARVLHARANETSNATQTNQFHHLIHKLEVDNIVQSRSSLMVTAGFNIGAAVIIALSILHDAWKNERRMLSVRPKRKLGFLYFSSKINPAEVFPLIFSTVIAMQGLIFLGIQGTGLQMLLMGNCSAISKIVWPAIWIVAYVLLVFGGEVAVRGCNKKRFAARGRWNTSICLLVVVVLLAFTEIPPQVRPPRHNHCLASLIWWASFWARTGVVINTMLVTLYVLIAGVIAYQLFRTVKIERDERIAASRMVYYLVVGIVLMSMVIPFWGRVTMRQDAGESSKVASVALNIFGLINLFLHLLLRSNSDNMALRPIQTPWVQRKEWRFFGASDLEVGQHIESPTVPERNGSLRRLVYEKEGSPFSPKSERTMQSKSAADARKSLPLAPLASQATIAPSFRHSRKKSAYSLFPVEGAELKRVASSIYADINTNNLMPPRPALFRNHKRDSSDLSSATVQIGLRLSNVATPTIAHDVGVERSSSLSRRPSHLNQELHRESDRSLELPIQIKETPAVEKPNPMGRSQAGVLERDSSRDYTPLASWSQRSDSLKRQSRRESWLRAREARMKTLPPIPATPTNIQPTNIQPANVIQSPELKQSGSWRGSKVQTVGSKIRPEWPLPLRESIVPAGLLLPNRTYQPNQPGQPHRSWI